MNRPTAIIADDEYLQRADLRRMLEKSWPELNIVAECEDGQEALEAIVDHQVNFAFLDIGMPELSGLDVARASDGKCRVVFTTAYDNYAIEAFQLGALDYLLKPILEDRLSHTVKRLSAEFELRDATKEAHHQNDMLRKMAELDQRLREIKSVDKIRWLSASVGKVIKIIPIEDVLYFESDLRYTRVVTAKDEAFIRTSLRELQQGLNPEEYWQIHRGTVVNIKAIDQARRDEFGNIHVELRGRDEHLKVSNSYAWRFKGM
ncbi:MAG: LytTR family DNA-binding domain-containing protein [Undibacterium sp.]|nr:LytTR family DNA-binding domain-containing protein [Undibacterium sp.]